MPQWPFEKHVESVKTEVFCVQTGNHINWKIHIEGQVLSWFARKWVELLQCS
jgi:hypothetical protein